MRKWVSGVIAWIMLLSSISVTYSVGAQPLSPFEEEGPVKAFANKWAILPEWSQAPVIDGALDEAMWAGAAQLEDFRTAYAYESAFGSAAYQAAYDSANIYIGGTFTLEEMEALARVEIVISPGTSGTFHYVAGIPISPNRALTTEWYRVIAPADTPQRVDLTGLVTATAENETEGTFSLEAAIPFASLGMSAVSAGDEWRMNVIHVHNVNTKPLSSWMPIRNSRYMDQSGGAVAYSANVVDQGRLGSVFFKRLPEGERWTPGNWKLNFSGYTRKQLSFAQTAPNRSEYRLEWIGPVGDWQELSGVDASTNGTMVELSFDHPEPRRDGMYQLRLTAYADDPDDALTALFSFDREQLIEAGTAALGYTIPSGGGATAVTPAPASAQVETIMGIIPDKPGFRYVGLPEMPELTPDGLYTLSTDGMSLISKRTNTVYPNSSYPETQSMTAIDRSGNTVVYPYYEDGQGKRYFLSAHLWYLQRSRALAQTDTISKTDPLGAARLLYRFAQAYETYVPTTDASWNTMPMNLTSGPPFNYWGGMWERWNLNDLNNLRPLLRAYARVQQTDALQVLGTELGVDAEKKIVEDMFLPSFDYVFSFPITLANLDKSIWFGLIEAGVALGQPEYIHKAVEWMNAYAEQRYLPDGSWYEVTTSYHNQATEGLVSAIDMLQGYTDPPGYVSPRTGKRFDNLDLYDEYPILDKARAFPKMLAYPTGKTVPVQDTWASDSEAEPNLAAGSMLLPSAGIGRLTVGEGSGQSQLYMQFTPKYGHNHYDPLSLNLFAEGQELLPDLGYTHSKYRYFAVSTIGHNTVVVNGRNMTIDDGSKHGGRSEQFSPPDGLFQVMRASQKEAYPETEEYSREPWLISFPNGGGKGYVLDLFRVSGGDRHEYTLQGDANHDAAFRTGLTLEDYGPRLLPPGVEAQEAEVGGESGTAEGHYPGYIYVKDVKRAELTDDRYAVTLDTYGDGAGAKLNITGLLEDGSNELFLGRSPSIRSTRLNGATKDNNDDVSFHDMPKLVLRRDGSNLTSTFATLLEPYGGGDAARIESIDRLVPDQAPAGAVAVQIAYGDTTDIVLSNPRHPDQPLVVGDVSMSGELGFIRLIDGAVTEMRLIGGTWLRKGSAEIIGTGASSATIVGTKRTADGDAFDALMTEAVVPADAVGRYVIVTHPDQSTNGYKIGGIQQIDGMTAIVLADQDHGFTYNEDGRSELNYYPAKRWLGPHTFRIASEAAYEGVPVPDASPTGTVTGTVYDPYGVPLGGSAVNLTGYSTITANTDMNGSFTLHDVPEGTRRVTATKPGYAPGVSEAVYVSAGQTVSVSVYSPNEVPPAISDATTAAGAGHPVWATSSKDGNLYLVPESTVPNAAEIEAAAATVGTAVYGIASGVPAMLDTDGLSAGLYRLFAIDARGALSTGVTVQLLSTDKQVIEDEDAEVKYAGSWTSFSNSDYSGGTVKRAQSAGANADIAFYGSAVKVLGSTSTSNGYANLYIDGVLQSTVDTYSATTKYRQLLYESGILPEGVHTLRIEATGTKRSAAANFYVTLDAVQVLHEEDVPYRLADVTTGPLTVGETVYATSPRSGMMYLVPSDTEATRAAIEAAGLSASGRSAAVTSGVYGILDTGGLASNWYRVYAIDTSGGLSEGSADIAIVSPVASNVEDDDAMVRYSGAWRRFVNTAYSGGSVERAESAGAYADIPFYGNGATVIGSLSFNNGQARIYIDGVYRTTIDAYNPTVQYKRNLFEIGSLEEGAHILRIEAAWTRNSASSGYYVSFDALEKEE